MYKDIDTSSFDRVADFVYKCATARHQTDRDIHISLKIKSLRLFDCFTTMDKLVRYDKTENSFKDTVMDIRLDMAFYEDREFFLYALILYRKLKSVYGLKYEPSDQLKTTILGLSQAFHGISSVYDALALLTPDEEACVGPFIRPILEDINHVKIAAELNELDPKLKDEVEELVAQKTCYYLSDGGELCSVRRHVKNPPVVLKHPKLWRFCLDFGPMSPFMITVKARKEMFFALKSRQDRLAFIYALLLFLLNSRFQRFKYEKALRDTKLGSGIYLEFNGFDQCEQWSKQCSNAEEIWSLIEYLTVYVYEGIEDEGMGEDDSEEEQSVESEEPTCEPESTELSRKTDWFHNNLTTIVKGLINSVVTVSDTEMVGGNSKCSILFSFDAVESFKTLLELYSIEGLSDDFDKFSDFKIVTLEQALGTDKDISLIYGKNRYAVIKKEASIKSEPKHPISWTVSNSGHPQPQSQNSTFFVNLALLLPQVDCPVSHCRYRGGLTPPLIFFVVNVLNTRLLRRCKRF